MRDKIKVDDVPQIDDHPVPIDENREMLCEILDVLAKQEPVSLEPVLKAIEELKATKPIETEDGLTRINPREALTAEEFTTMCGQCEYRRKHDQKSKTKV